VDPEVLFIGTGAGTPCFAGCGGDPNSIPPTTLSIFENGNGQPPLVSPLLMIVGIPNFAGSAPGIASISAGTGLLGGANLFGGSWNPTTGLATNNGGSFTGAFNGSVYQFIGLAPPASASESFTNWSGADLARNGITATGFAIFVYTLSNTSGTTLTGGTGISLSFTSGLPVGSFVVAYGCSATTGSVCSGTGTTFGTPFTNAGVTVPEPSTLALLAFGIFGLAVLARHRRDGSPPQHP